MNFYEGPVQNLIDEFAKLPGIGPKGAQRIAFHLLQVPSANIDRFIAALATIREGVQFCDVCGTVSEGQRCRICSDVRRDSSMVCVVEEPKDVQAIERTGVFRGRYHVLGGALNPLSGIGPDQLRIRELVTRIGNQDGAVHSNVQDQNTVHSDADNAQDDTRGDDAPIREIIIATDPNTEGEATAMYLSRLLRDVPDLKVTRLASGLPMGGDIEFADELTLGRALSGRREL